MIDWQQVPLKKNLAFIVLSCLLLLGVLFISLSQRASEEVADKDSVQKQGGGVTFIPSQEATSSAEIVVYVAGSVQRPDVYSLPLSSRVADALKAAGGLSEKADPQAVEIGLNLAEVLKDGDKIYIPTKGETNQPATLSGSTLSSKEKATGLINLNTASAEEIAEANLYRIGEKTAAKIVQYRNQNGPFKAVEDLTNVPGIGESIIEGIRNYVTF